MFHTSLLSPYNENDTHGSNFPWPPPDLIAEEEEYEIERILCHQGNLSNCSFFIRWKGFSTEEDSWEPEQNLKYAKSALEEYKRRHPTIFR